MSRIEARRAAEQRLFAARAGVDDEHDHHRVGARKVLRAAMRAVAPRAAEAHRRRRAADRAEAVADVPVEHGARLGERAEMARRQAWPEPASARSVTAATCVSSIGASSASAAASRGPLSLQPSSTARVRSAPSASRLGRREQRVVAGLDQRRLAAEEVEPRLRRRRARMASESGPRASLRRSMRLPAKPVRLLGSTAGRPSKRLVISSRLRRVREKARWRGRRSVYPASPRHRQPRPPCPIPGPAMRHRPGSGR